MRAGLEAMEDVIGRKPEGQDAIERPSRDFQRWRGNEVPHSTVTPCECPFARLFLPLRVTAVICEMSFLPRRLGHTATRTHSFYIVCHTSRRPRSRHRLRRRWPLPRSPSSQPFYQYLNPLRMIISDLPYLPFINRSVAITPNASIPFTLFARSTQE